MLPRADLCHDSEMPELVEHSDDDEMPANSDQRGDLPPLEWNHPPWRGVSHEPTEDRILTRLMGRRWRRGEKARVVVPEIAASKRR